MYGHLTYGSRLTFLSPDGNTNLDTSSNEIMNNNWYNVTVAHQKGLPVRIYKNENYDILYTSSEII